MLFCKSYSPQSLLKPDFRPQISPNWSVQYVTKCTVKLCNRQKELLGRQELCKTGTNCSIEWVENMEYLKHHAVANWFYNLLSQLNEFVTWSWPLFWFVLLTRPCAFPTCLSYTKFILGLWNIFVHACR